MELSCIKECLLCVPRPTAEVPPRTVRPHLASHVGPATLSEVTYSNRCYHRLMDTTESYVPTASQTMLLEDLRDNNITHTGVSHKYPTTPCGPEGKCQPLHH